MINSKLLYKYDYSLMWKNEEVLRFNPNKHQAKIINNEKLGYNTHNFNNHYEIILSFCADRVLMMNREHCKEILTSCNIDDQSALGICLISRALSFRDNFWFKKCRDNITWESINLYTNKFSEQITKVAITGETEVVNIDDGLFTGELTSKGTRAKSYIRNNGKVFLYKVENADEINSEIVSFYIAKALNLPSAMYFSDKLYGKHCSVCQILTNEDVELILYRELLSNYGGQAYSMIMNLDPANFIKMQVFDYITLNTDRNRDNYGVVRYKGKFYSLYPIYDHDSCFKGKGTNATYFPTGMTFAKTLEFLKTFEQYAMYINKEQIHYNIVSVKDKIIYYKDEKTYNEILKRIERL